VPGEHTHVPLHDGARHFVVLATLSRNPEGRVADLLGDLLVSPRSATGDTGDDGRLAFPADHVHRIGGLHHLDLLDHPLVYGRLRDWLEHRPEGPQPGAPRCRGVLSRHSWRPIAERGGRRRGPGDDPARAGMTTTDEYARTWLERHQDGVDPDEALGYFDSLPVVTPAEMARPMAGTGLITGSPLDGLLEAYGWYGKEFLDEETVHPLLFTDRSGRPRPLDPTLLPVTVLRDYAGFLQFWPLRTVLSGIRPAAVHRPAEGAAARGHPPRGRDGGDGLRLGADHRRVPAGRRRRPAGCHGHARAAVPLPVRASPGRRHELTGHILRAAVAPTTTTAPRAHELQRRGEHRRQEHQGRAGRPHPRRGRAGSPRCARPRGRRGRWPGGSPRSSGCR
jgi:hypothetical protein